MEYQKLLSEEEIAKIYVTEGGIVSFYDLEGKLCTKNAQGVVSKIEDKIDSVVKENTESNEIVNDIDNLIG